MEEMKDADLSRLFVPTAYATPVPDTTYAVIHYQVVWIREYQDPQIKIRAGIWMCPEAVVPEDLRGGWAVCVLDNPEMEFEQDEQFEVLDRMRKLDPHCVSVTQKTVSALRRERRIGTHILLTAKIYWRPPESQDHLWA